MPAETLMKQTKKKQIVFERNDPELKLEKEINQVPLEWVYTK